VIRGGFLNRSTSLDELHPSPQFNSAPVVVHQFHNRFNMNITVDSFSLTLTHAHRTHLHELR
jgi:hypothetical protein